ncbi:hypothetical protein HDU87_004464 [Geranomyces variabilis]|uniref:Uncharacterized protein n=1 Tax=Geranomyces variabilis TaxID=109894 RepID=A0AAD5XQN3_9FUNG|nr:hypothetical protein HDU87_004464 [Geranomyces variabilis]
MDPDDIDDMDFDLPAGVGQMQLNAGAGPTPHPLGVAEAHRQRLLDEQRKSEAEMKEASKTWTCVYPIYISPTGKSHRKIPLSLCPTPTPAALYIAECVHFLRLPAAIEPEARHPADPLVFGRIKVQLRDPATKKHLNPQITSKKKLLREIAKYYNGIELKLNQANPKVKQMALASRSELSSVVGDLSGTVEPEVKPEAKAVTDAKPSASGGGGKKKGKKK